MPFYPSRTPSKTIPFHQVGNTAFKFVLLLLIVACAYFGYTKFFGNTVNANLSPQELSSKNKGLYILAGSELKDLEPYIPQIKKATGIQIGFEYTGTLDGVDAINSGKKADVAWFSHGKYLSLVNPQLIKSQSQIMLSPVVMGIKQSKAKQFGWINADGSLNEVTWQNIADKSANGQLKFAMTNPASSNSGFTALMGVVAALAGTADAPKEKDIDLATPKLKGFFKGQSLNSGSSGWLAEQFVKEQKQLDAIINYESVLMQLNASGQLIDPLILLYPKEGIVTADYPIMLLNPEKKQAFDTLTHYLKSAEFQQIIMEQTNRRPINTQVKLANKFNVGKDGFLVELPFPNNHKIIDNILMSYQNKLRKPAHVYFVLDLSGSMSGEGLKQLKGAMLSLTTAKTGSSRFAKFSKQEKITLIPFDDTPYTPMQFDLQKNYKEELNRLSYTVQTFAPGGSTAIYDSLETAYKTVQSNIKQDKQNGVDKYYSIVLMTDGDNSYGHYYSDFEQNYASLPQSLKTVKTFTVLFGNANEAEMQKVALLTGGKMFDGRKTNLAQVFKKIRGYQ